MKTPVSLLALVILAACASSSPQVVVDPQSSPLRLRTSASSVMVRDISLPTYAQASEISVRTADGTLVETTGRVWADEPTRAMTGAMVRNLGVITGAQVSAEPWPLEGYPDLELTIRVEHMFAREDGSVTLSGYYAVRPEARRGAIRQFDLTLPAPETGGKDPAAAYEAAWTKLAEAIARDL